MAVVFTPIADRSCSMKFGKRRIIRISIVILTAALGAVILFLSFGERFLRIVKDDPQTNAGAVVTLAGTPLTEDNQRIREGIRLYQQGRGRYLILPLRHTTFKWSWAVDNYKLEQSIPDAHLLIGRSTPPDDPVIAQYGGTYVEAKKTVGIMRQHGIQSAIVVSSAYHMRRAEIAFEQCAKGYDLQFYYHPVERASASGSPWWTDSRYVYRILREYKKLLAAYFIYNR